MVGVERERRASAESDSVGASARNALTIERKEDVARRLAARVVSQLERDPSVTIALDPNLHVGDEFLQVRCQASVEGSATGTRASRASSSVTSSSRKFASHASGAVDCFARR